MRRKYGDAPTYPMLYRLLVAGLVPGRRVRNKWRLPPAAEARVVELTGLTPKSSDAAA